jgi:predicted alpha/beta hydrolase family esterase
MTTTHRVLLLPGWQDSGPQHWHTRWEQRQGWQRVQQDDWLWPRRGDWMARLEDTLLADERPAVLVAHSLGCHLVAAWAAHSRHTARVSAALLVAIPDVERPDMPPQLHGWRPAVRRRLPFRALAVLSTDDPFASLVRAEGYASDWGAGVVHAGAFGHLNGDSGLDDWPEGRHLLQTLMG